jgi:predicted Zn-dependent peptidase
LIKKWFGEIPRRNVPERNIPQEPVRTSQEVLTVERDVTASLIAINFHVGRRIDSDFFINDLLSDVLSNGPSARLTQTLMKDRQLFSDINAYISGDMDPGLFTVTGRIMPGVTMEEAEESIWQQLNFIARDGLTGVELQKVKNKMESNLVFSEISFLNKAMNLAQYELMGDADEINKEIEHYRAVTADEIQQAAKTIFRPENSTVLRYLAVKQ